MDNAYIKIGDSFAVPIQFYDTQSNQGMIITEDMLITAQIVNSSNQVIATPIISVYEQQTNTGMILLEVPVATTQLWKVGSAQLDIKLEINGHVRHSQNIQFRIERSITA